MYRLNIIDHKDLVEVSLYVQDRIFTVYANTVKLALQKLNNLLNDYLSFNPFVSEHIIISRKIFNI